MRTDTPATWFRLYAEFANDPKVQMLTEIDQRRFLMLLCLRCSNGLVTLQDTEVAFQLRILDAQWLETKATLLGKKLIDEHNKPTKWESRQFDSDTSNARVAKHRALQKEKQTDTGNADVTLPKRKSNALDTETETEKIQRRKNTSAIAPPDGVDISVWKDWLRIRKSKRLPWTETAWHEIQAEIVKAGITDDAAIRECCARGWGSFKADWHATHNGNVETFKQRDARDARKRWEEMTGSISPDSISSDILRIAS